MRKPDAGDAVGNGDARQASAAIECVIPMLVTLSGMVTLVRLLQLQNANPDAGDAVGNGDARQASCSQRMRNSRCW